MGAAAHCVGHRRGSSICTLLRCDVDWQSTFRHRRSNFREQRFACGKTFEPSEIVRSAKHHQAVPRTDDGVAGWSDHLPTTLDGRDEHTSRKRGFPQRCSNYWRAICNDDVQQATRLAGFGNAPADLSEGFGGSLRSDRRLRSCR